MLRRAPLELTGFPWQIEQTVGLGEPPLTQGQMFQPVSTWSLNREPRQQVLKADYPRLSGKSSFPQDASWKHTCFLLVTLLARGQTSS